MGLRFLFVLQSLLISKNFYSGYASACQAPYWAGYSSPQYPAVNAGSAAGGACSPESR